MRQLLLILIFATLPINSLFTQSNGNPIYDAIRYRGLTNEDISIPINFSDTTATNNNRLRLPIVERLMKNPLEYEGWVDSVGNTDFSNNYNILNILYQSINSSFYGTAPSNINFYTDGNRTIENLIRKFNLENLIKLQNQSIKKSFTEEDLEFLKKHLISFLAGQETFSIDDKTTNIFKYNISRDSSEVITRRVAEILSKFDDKYISNISVLHDEISSNAYGVSVPPDVSLIKMDNESVKGSFYYYSEENGIRIAIGGKGKNYYKGKFNLIIDYGGDDVYDLENDNILENNFSVIIDYSGNDTYTALDNFALASGVFSFSYLLDMEGDDVYKGKSVTLGAGICGLGILEDRSGNDIYYSNSFSIGAGAFGIGLVLDKVGNDIYSANTYSQGFGLTKGAGAIVDNSGNDSYLINSLSLDMGRYEDHFVSMCQGYGLGLRPYYAGGVGLIIEGGGNDIYATDIFGQGGAYWYGLGAIIDKSGHDKYNSYQYGQGAGIHLAVGVLKDYDGWDFYSSNGVSQGCGHDYGVGILDDVRGNDNYSAYSLSQGAGNANGIGILIDRSGRDGYLNKEPGNTRGYGNLRREYGSIGLFVDGAGNDFYSVGGMDSTVYNKSYWGEGLDLYYADETGNQNTSEGYKVELQPLKDFYSVEEYFIMAKTIEPRFSLWQKYGEERLLEDSTGTAEHMLTKLGTDDHRETFLMRNIIVKMPVAVSDVFNKKLEEYKTNKDVLTPGELSMMAYLYGETQSPLGKDALLLLTYDDDLRVRSTALLALGKIKYDPEDKEFISAVSSRLREMAKEDQDSKLYNKNLLYAFNNFPDVENFPTVFGYLSNEFFGARFLAADALSKYPQYISFLMGMMPANGSPLFINDYAVIAFIYSLSKLNDEEYKTIIESLTNLPVTDAQKYNMIKSLMDKRDASENGEFKQWTNDKINSLKEGLPLKVE